MRTPRLMIIGATWSSEPLAKAAKALGCWVLATRTGHVDGILSADETVELNPRDTIAALELAHRYCIDGVIYDGDGDALVAAAFVCNALHFPGPSLRSAILSTDKREFRRRIAELGVLQPPFFIGRREEDLYEGATRVGGFPVVVKPVDGQGARGVSRVGRPEELACALADVRTSSRAEEFIVEKYIGGAVLVVDGIGHSAGNHAVLAIAAKKTLDDASMRTAELFYPASGDRETLQRAAAAHLEIVQSLGYESGLAHSEFILDAQGMLWLLESANRGSGYFASSLLLPAATGIDLWTLQVRYALGENLEKKIAVRVPYFRAALAAAFQFRSGRVRAISGLEGARAIPGVLRCDLLVKTGDMITPESERHGYFLIAADTAAEVRAIERRVRKTVRIEYGAA